MLMEYMAARLGGPEGQFLNPYGSRQADPSSGKEELTQTRSGLEDLHTIEQALPQQKDA